MLFRSGIRGPGTLVAAVCSRLMFRFPQPVMQTAATNVPGPRIPLYLLGRQLVEIHPYVPIGNNILTAIGIFSYLDQLNFGVTTDFDGVPDIGVLRGGIRTGIEELLDRATPAAPAPARPPRKRATPRRPAGTQAARSVDSA